MDPRWKHPFTALIAGPTGSGKTVFVRQFLSNLPDKVILAPEDVIWCYGEWQTMYDDMKGVHFHEGLSDTEKWTGDRRRLVFIDNLMSETDDRVTKLFTKGSHHRNISVMYIVQNLFGKNKDQRTISLNSPYIIIFKNSRDGSQITLLAKQMYPSQTWYVQESFKDVTEAPRGYLIFNLRQEIRDFMVYFCWTRHIVHNQHYLRCPMVYLY